MHRLALIAPEVGSKLYEFIGRPTDVVFVTDDVVARFREWSGRGVKFLSTPKLRRVKPASRTPILQGDAPVWGGVFTHFKDLDGNSFSLVSFDEITHAIEAERRASMARAEAERRMAHELEIAKEVQFRLFPQLQSFDAPVRSHDTHCRTSPAQFASAQIMSGTGLSKGCSVWNVAEKHPVRCLYV